MSHDKKMIIDKWKKYYTSGQIMSALLIGFVTLLITCMIIFGNPVAGVMDYGEYTQTLSEMGLEWTEEALSNPDEMQFVKVIEEYEVGSIQYLRLLQLEPTQSLVYPVSLINIFCKICGVCFSTRYLAVLLSLLMAFSMYTITKALYHYFRGYSIVIGLVSCFVLLCGNYIIYFNSLYSSGFFLVSIIMLMALLLRAISSDEKNPRWMLSLFVVSLMIVNNNKFGIFLLPIIVALLIFMAIKCRPAIEGIIKYIILCVLGLGLLISINLRFSVFQGDFLSDTELYHSVFTGILENTNEPEEVLKEMNLEPKLAGDIGKTAYLSKKNYVVAPFTEQGEKEIFSKVTFPTIVNTYLSYPDVYMKTLNRTAEIASSVDSERLLYTNRRADEGTEWVERFVWWQWIRSLIIPKSFMGYMVLFTTLLAFVLVIAIIHRKNPGKRELCIVMMVPPVIAMIEYFTLGACIGFAELQNELYDFVVCFDFAYIVIISISIYALWRFSRLFQTDEEAEEEDESAVELQEEIDMPSPLCDLMYKGMQKTLLFFKNKVFCNEKRSALIFTVIAAVVVMWVMFFPNRIGAYNNGDFGRMMVAMNIKYTAEDWANADELSLTKVVERFDWEDDYDYSKIMFYNADLSQAWFSVVLKLLDNYVGLGFSTVYVAIMYAIIIIICFYFICKVLFKRFGYHIIPVILAMLFIFFDRDNLGWLNSLFGEGIAFVSFLMVLACALVISDMERGTCRWSFVLYFFSVNMFAESKAQFVVTAPFMLIFGLILVIYHMPKKIWKRIIYYLCLSVFFITIPLGCIHIYQNNTTVSSPDQIFNALFYGILMISDDPAAELESFGLDPAMAVDTGKHAFMDKSNYYIAPRTEEAEEELYSKVSSVDFALYYLKHPDKLWYILNQTAIAAGELMPDFLLYVGEKTTDVPHHIVTEFSYWRNIRPYIAIRQFWILLIIYAVILWNSILFWKRRNSGKDKLLLGVLWMSAFIGVIQFPITVIGNGFADNTKQLYIFRITLDLLILFSLYLAVPYVRKWIAAGTEKIEKRKELHKTEEGT